MQGTLKIKAYLNCLTFVEHLCWLDQIRTEQIDWVGYKAFYLGHLLQKSGPVKPGVVVTASVWRSFLETIAWSDPFLANLPTSFFRVDIDNPRQLQAIARQLQAAIATATLPDTLLQEFENALPQLSATTLILRPSLKVETSLISLEQRIENELMLKTSGLLTSQVCYADRSSLSWALKQVWSGLFSAKSLFYWQRLGISLHQVQLAVLIQPIESAIAAGTVKTTGETIEICSTVGLGMAIDRGEVMPDIHQINLKTGDFQYQKLGYKPIAYRLSTDAVSGAYPISLGYPAPLFIEKSTPRDPTALEKAPLLLHTYGLDDHQQASFVLEESQIQALIPIVQGAIAAMGPFLKLEWVLPISTESQHSFYITQIIPQTSSSTSYSLPPMPPSKQGIAATTGTPANDIQVLTAFPGATLLTTGLSTSPGQAIARATVITNLSSTLDNVLPHTVLVAPTFPLDWIPHLQTAAALIAEQGSVTSHSAIVAREAGIPMVMGVANATELIQPGELLWVDGDRGNLYRLTDPAQPNQHQAISSFSPAPPATVSATAEHLPLRTRLMVNLSQPNQLRSVSTLPIDGVGLLRAELLALAILEGQRPWQWLQHHPEAALVDRLATAIAQFADAFSPRPVFYRSLDIRSHEFQPGSMQNEDSHKSVLGLRGAFSYGVDPTVFKLEIEALARVQRAGHTNVHLLLPFVRTVEEFQVCRDHVEQAGLMQVPNFELWIMAEVPSVLLLLPDYVEAGVQGISIGTNDLTQLLLGVDRDQPQFAPVLETCHPAVKRAIAQLIQQSQELGILCSICGEAPVRYPELIADLVHWGIHSISVSPEAVESSYWQILQAEQTELLDQLRSQA